MHKPYASWVKILALLLLLVIYRDYLPGEPSPFLSVNLEIAPRSPIVRVIGLIVFPIVWIGSVASIMFAPFLSISILRVSLASIFLCSWLFNILILTVTHAESPVGVARENMVEPSMLVLIWANREKLADTIEAYSELAPTIIALTLVWLIFAWRPSLTISIRGKWNIAACLPIALVVAIAVYSRGGAWTFPTPVGFPITFANAIAEVRQQDVIAERVHARPVTFRARNQRFEKIVLIMDESVRAGFVNSTLIGKWGLIDYGETTSGGNCSTFSRFAFRHGLKPADLPQAFLPRGLVSEEPTVWQFAKAAGYKTIYIDALGSAVLHDGINSDELSYMDEKYYINTLPKYMRDVDALKRLIAVMSQPGRVFIYVDKQGAHFAYQDKYPPNHVPNFEGQIAKLKIPENKDLREYQRGLLDRYNRAIDWSVNKFIFDLFAHGLPEDTLLIYTSDHGQSLVENNTKLTHCGSGSTTVDGEGLVPLLVHLRQDTTFSQLLRDNARNFHNKYSHFQLFPTILVALGYPMDVVTQSYGSSLLDPPPHTRQFLKGKDARKLEWQTVK